MFSSVCISQCAQQHFSKFVPFRKCFILKPVSSPSCLLQLESSWEYEVSRGTVTWQITTVIHQILKLLTTDLEHHLCSYHHSPFLSQQGTAGTNSAEQSVSFQFTKVETSKTTMHHAVESWPPSRKVSNTWLLLLRSITCTHWFAAKYFSVSIST